MEEKSAGTASSSKTKHNNVSTGNKLLATVTFQPARGAVGSFVNKNNKAKNYTHDIFFYIMNRHERCHSVAVVIGGGGKIYGGSWLQKVMDDIINGRGDDMFPLHYHKETFYLCHEGGDIRLNDEG